MHLAGETAGSDVPAYQGEIRGAKGEEEGGAREKDSAGETGAVVILYYHVNELLKRPFCNCPSVLSTLGSSRGTKTSI